MGIKGLRAAIRTLSVIPIPGKESTDLSSALPWFPLVGLLLGGILWLLGLLLALSPFPQWSSGCAVVLLIVYVLLTRGLHMDGLADWADSIGGFGREKKLAIMKDVSMGAFGTLALILALMMRWVAFDRLLSSDTFIWVMAVMTISRSMLVELTTTMPYARSGEGMAKPFVEKATGKQRLLSFVITLALCLLIGPIGLGLYLVAWIITLLFKVYCLANFGGITGDLLGAANEIIEIALLALCALPGTYISGCIGWGWLTWM